MHNWIKEMLLHSVLPSWVYTPRHFDFYFVFVFLKYCQELTELFYPWVMTNRVNAIGSGFFSCASLAKELHLSQFLYDSLSLDTFHTQWRREREIQRIASELSVLRKCFMDKVPCHMLDQPTKGHTAQ